MKPPIIHPAVRAASLSDVQAVQKTIAANVASHFGETTGYIGSGFATVFANAFATNDEAIAAGTPVAIEFDGQFPAPHSYFGYLHNQIDQAADQWQRGQLIVAWGVQGDAEPTDAAKNAAEITDLKQRIAAKQKLIDEGFGTAFDHGATVERLKSEVAVMQARLDVLTGQKS